MKVRMRKTRIVVKSHRSEQRAEGSDGEEGAGGGGESVQSKGAGLPWISACVGQGEASSARRVGLGGREPRAPCMRRGR